MTLKNWKHEIVDLSCYKGFRCNPKLSVLANAVDFLNLELSREVRPDDRILEVGCGCQSLLLESLEKKSNWEGIDVSSETLRGEKVIATKIASVSSVPFQDQSFDIVLANQSIEHWHEYHVSPLMGLAEIRRVLKSDGRAIINFPIHLHGSPSFVKGDFDAIDKAFADAGLEINKRTAVIDKRLPDYRGWAKCGFPDFYIKTLSTSESTSFVVEYEAIPKLGTRTVRGIRAKRIRKRRSVLQRNLDHGIVYLFWKILRRLKRNGS